MLDAYIIEELKRREQEERRRKEKRPCLELPLEGEVPPDHDQERHCPDPEEARRGVIVFDFKE